MHDRHPGIRSNSSSTVPTLMRGSEAIRIMLCLGTPPDNPGFGRCSGRDLPKLDRFAHRPLEPARVSHTHVEVFDSNLTANCDWTRELTVHWDNTSS